MKCVKKIGGSKILRISDEKARELVDSGTHSYCSKVEWKKQRTKEEKKGVS